MNCTAIIDLWSRAKREEDKTGTVEESKALNVSQDSRKGMDVAADGDSAGIAETKLT